MKKLVLMLAMVLTMSGCGMITRTEEQKQENTQKQENKKDNTSDTLVLDFTVNGMPVIGTVKRSSETLGEKISEEVKAGTATKAAKTTVEMPPEFAALVSQLGALVKVAGVFGLPGASAGGSFLDKLGAMATSPEGVTMAGGVSGTVGLTLMQLNRRRLQDQLEKKEKEVSDDYEKDVRQIVKAIDGFLTDPMVTPECKQLLKDYLSKHMDRSAKDLVSSLKT